MTQTGYPHGRPGYVVDHVIPLKRGGADAPWNMQWQTIAEGKAKDATGNDSGKSQDSKSKDLKTIASKS